MRPYPAPFRVENLQDVSQEFAKISQCSYGDVPSIIAMLYTLPVFTALRNLVIPTLDAAPATQAFPSVPQGLANYPVLRVHLNAASQNLGSFSSNVKVLFDAVDVDTASWWDATNHRYTPQQAGYYSVRSQVIAQPGVGGLTALSALYSLIFKTGAADAEGGIGLASGSNLGACFAGTSDIVHCNGSTDYIETFANVTGTGTASIQGANSWFTFMAIDLVAPPLLTGQPNLLSAPGVQAIDPTSVINAIRVLATLLSDFQKGGESRTV